MNELLLVGLLSFWVLFGLTLMLRRYINMWTVIVLGYFFCCSLISLVNIATSLVTGFSAVGGIIGGIIFNTLAKKYTTLFKK